MSGMLACHKSMQLAPGCWVSRGVPVPLPMICPVFFSLEWSGTFLHWLIWLVKVLGRKYQALNWDMLVPKMLATLQAVASQRLSTPLQLSQKLTYCVCCRRLATNWLPCAIGLATAHMIEQLSARYDPSQPSQCCSTRLKKLLISLMALPLP